MLFCRKCGAELEEGEKYCYRCGFAQSGAKAETKQGNNGNKTALVVAIMLAIVLLAGAGAGAVIYFCYPDLLSPGTGEAAGEDGEAEAETEKVSAPDTGAEAEEYSDNIVVPDSHSTIQEAINSSRDGEVITVKPGTYYENIDFKGKDITLESTEPHNPDVVAETILDGNSNGTVVTFQSGESSGAVLTGFTITGGSGTRKRFDITSYDGSRLKFERQYGAVYSLPAAAPPR